MIIDLEYCRANGSEEPKEYPFDKTSTLIPDDMIESFKEFTLPMKEAFSHQPLSWHSAFIHMLKWLIYNVSQIAESNGWTERDIFERKHPVYLTVYGVSNHSITGILEIDGQQYSKYTAQPKPNLNK